jgi:hypothetical protein
VCEASKAGHNVQNVEVGSFDLVQHIVSLSFAQSADSCNEAWRPLLIATHVREYMCSMLSLGRSFRFATLNGAIKQARVTRMRTEALQPRK